MEWLSDILNKLSEKQKKIDEYIKNKNNLIINKQIFNKKIIALFTEISEFVNELKCFKFWSKKSESARNIILEEYIDCIHFILSIGNDINFKWKDYKLNLINVNDINELILNSYKSLSNFTDNLTKDNFKLFLDNFLSILVFKNISEKEVYEAYLMKNDINYKRQMNNY